MLPRQLEMACLAYRSLFVAEYRRRLLGHTGTQLTLIGRLFTVHVVNVRTVVPPLWLYRLERWTTGMVLPQLLLLGLRGGHAPAEQAAAPAHHTVGGTRLWRDRGGGRVIGDLAVRRPTGRRRNRTGVDRSLRPAPSRP